MTKSKAKPAWKKKWSAPKPKYRKPSPAKIEERKRTLDLETRFELLVLRMNVIQSQQQAIYGALTAAMQEKVQAYEEE